MHTTRLRLDIISSKVLFFPSVIREWNKLDLEIHNSASLEIFKKHLLNFIGPNFNNAFNINNLLGTIFLTHLRIGFSCLKEHEFKHNFQDSIHPLRNWGNDVESRAHFFFNYANFTTQRQTFLSKLKSVNASILAEDEN